MLKRINRRSAILAIVAAGIISTPNGARAQNIPCPEIACRAQVPYGNCGFASVDGPAEGTVAFVGTVTNSVRIACERRLTVEVAQSSGSLLPSTVQIRLGPCMYWTDQVGAAIKAVVADVPREGAYEARICYH